MMNRNTIERSIIRTAVLWADSIDAESALDERPPKSQSNVNHRVVAANALQEIRRLVKLLKASDQ